MLFRNRMLGGVSSLALYAPETGAGAAGAGGSDGGAGGAGNREAGAAGGAAGGAGGSGAAGAAAGSGGAAGGAAAGGAGGTGAAGAGTAGAAGAAGAAAGAGATIGAGTGAAAGAAAAPPKFPDDWRAQLAGDDKAFLKQLERFDSPTAVAKSWRELSTKISSGELKAPAAPPAADATAEQLAAWRKEQGLPAQADGYVAALALPDGVLPGETDKPILGQIAAAAMKGNWSQAQMNEVSSLYFAMQDQATQARDQRDAQYHDQSVQALTAEWGKEFRANQNVIASVMALAPAELAAPGPNGQPVPGALLLEARLPDGSKLGDNPAALKFITLIGREINPASTVLPAAAGGGLSGVESRISEIEGKFMRAPQGSAEWRQYWQGEKMQGELRELYGAREKMSARQAAA